MLCRIFFQIYIKNKTEITEIDIAESKIQLKKNKSATEPKKKGIRLNSRAREKEPTELKSERSVRSPTQAMYYSR